MKYTAIQTFFVALCVLLFFTNFNPVAAQCNAFAGNDTLICGFSHSLLNIETGGTWDVVCEESDGSVVFETLNIDTTIVTVSNCGIYTFTYTVSEPPCTDTDTVRINFLDPSSTQYFIDLDPNLEATHECHEGASGCTNSLMIDGVSPPSMDWSFDGTMSCTATIFDTEVIDDTLGDCLADGIIVGSSSSSGGSTIDWTGTQDDFITIDPITGEITNNFEDLVNSLIGELLAGGGCPLPPPCPMDTTIFDCDSTVTDTLYYPVPVYTGGQWTYHNDLGIQEFLNDTTLIVTDGDEVLLVIEPSAVYQGPAGITFSVFEITSANDTIIPTFSIDIEVEWVNFVTYDTLEQIIEVPAETCPGCGGVSIISDALPVLPLPDLSCPPIGLSFDAPLMVEESVECLGGGYYMVILEITNGTMPYTVSGIPGTVSFDTFYSEPLEAGSFYTYTVSDSGGCPPVSGSVSDDCLCAEFPFADFSYDSNNFCIDDPNPLPNFFFDCYTCWYQFYSPDGLDVNSYTGEISLGSAIPGTYTVLLEVSDFCFSDIMAQTITINEPPFIATSGDATICEGESVTLQATGATGCVWSTGEEAPFITVAPTTTTTYSVMVEEGGCLASAEATVFVMEAPFVSGSSSVDASCGNADGEASIIVSGGMPPYSYQWSSGGIGETETGLWAGTYTVMITDVNGCTTSETVFINDTGSPDISGGVTAMATCGQANGAIAGLLIAGGSPPYTYNWTDNLGNSIGTAPDLVNVAAGLYTLEVADSDGCTYMMAFTLTGTNDLVTSGGLVTDASCGETNGSIEGISVIGGTMPYSYIWTDDLGNTIGTDLDLINLPAGLYTLEVTDNDGCTSELSISIIDTDGPQLSNGMVTDAACGGTDGSVENVLITGGTPPYVYEWFDATTGNLLSTNMDLIDVAAGNYSLQVTDANGCESMESFVIPDNTLSIQSEGAIIDTPCGEANGAIIGVVVIGGNGTYTYSWTDANGNELGENLDLMGLVSGSYTLTVLDASGCSTTAEIVVASLSESYTEELTLPSCFGQNVLFDGVELAPDTTTPFTYTATNGCDSTVMVSVDASEISFGITTQKACWNSPNGSLEIEWLGSGTGHEFSLDGVNFQTERLFTDLVAGDYILHVQGDNGCLISENITIAESPQLQIEVPTTWDICDGPLTIDARVDESLYETVTYSWDEGTTDGIYSITESGIYQIQVANECETVKRDVLVTSNRLSNGMVAIVPTAFSPNNDGMNDCFQPIPYGVTGDYLFQVYDRWGTMVFSTSDPTACWEGFIKGKPVQIGVYTWFITATIETCEGSSKVFQKGNVTAVR